MYPITKYEDTFLENYLFLSRLPNDYDPKGHEEIRIFGERLQTVLDTVEERNGKPQLDEVGHRLSGDNDCSVRNAAQLAEALNLSPARISQFVNGNVKSVPMGHLFKLYDIFGVTPHYFLGLVSRMDGVLALDDQGNVIYKDGKPLETVFPMSSPSEKERKVHDQFLSKLYWETPKQYKILLDLLNADEKTRTIGFQMISLYLASHEPK